MADLEKELEQIRRRLDEKITEVRELKKYEKSLLQAIKLRNKISGKNPGPEIEQNQIGPDTQKR